MGLPCLSEFLSDDASTPIGLPCSPFVVTRHRDLTLGVSRHRLPRVVTTRDAPSLRLRLPFRVLPKLAAGPRTSPDVLSAHFSRGFFPSDVFPTTKSHLPPTVSIPPVTLRPQGFAPSRRFAPSVACRAYFIPVPSMGFPLRGFRPPIGAVRPLGRRLPPAIGKDTDFTVGRNRRLRCVAPASGLYTPLRVPVATPVVNLRRHWLPPWGFSPSRLPAAST